MMAKKNAKSGLTVLREMRGHADVEWEIRNFFYQPYDHGECLESPNFLLGDAEWCIEIYPNRDSIECRNDWISLYLRRTSGSGIHTVSFCICIKAGSSIISTNINERNFSKKNCRWGWNTFLERSTIADVLNCCEPSYGAVTVVCTARLLDGRHKEATTQTSQLEDQNKEATSATSLTEGENKEVTSATSRTEGQNKDVTSSTSRTEGSQAFPKHFEELFLGGNWSDVKIKVGERVFDVHKLVLRARSPVFSAMFDHEMAETSSGVVNIPDMDPESFRDFLLFLYTGQFTHVTSSNAVCLYKAADKYAVEELKEECNRCMVSDLSVETVLGVIALATTFGEDKILKITSEFFLENAAEIVSTENWELFLEQNIPIANELLIKMAKSLKAHRTELVKLRK